MPRTSPLRRYVLGALFGLWLVSIFAIYISLIRYKMTPGEGSRADAHWREESRLEPSSEMPTLLFFAHPGCPCTRASLSSLRAVLSRFEGRVKVYVLFYEPAQPSADWLQTDTVEAARGLSGVITLPDPGGVEARLFDAQTSGQVLLFSAQGDLLFRGGITPARNHDGGNPQLDVVLSLLASETTPDEVIAGPVFGCPILEPR